MVIWRMINKSLKKCTKDLLDLLEKNKWGRGTLDHDQFKKLVGRQRIEDSFIKTLSDYMMDHSAIFVFKVSWNQFLLVRVSTRPFPSLVLEESD